MKPDWELGWEHTNEPTPPDHIRLADAFKEFYRKSIPDWEERLAQAKAAIVDSPNAAAAAEARATDALALVTDAEEKAALVAQRKAARATRAKALRAARKNRTKVVAVDDGRVGAAKKFVAALAAGELQPMIQRANGAFGVLPSKLWVRDEHVPLVAGRDAVIVCDGRCHTVFLESKYFQDWCCSEIPVSPGLRPIDLCRQQLKAWAADRTTLLREARKWAREGRHSKAWISLALAAWLFKIHGVRLTPGHIENELRDDLTPIVNML
jgi:hypothetical protein